MQTFKNNMADSERAENIKSISADDLSRCVDEIKNIFGVDKLSTNQFDGLLHFLNGRDIFVSLPTGSGKSLIFQMAPLVEKWIARTDPQSYRRKDAVIVVVCPLIALMEDQIARLNSIGLKAAYIGNNQTEDVLRAIENGEYTFVFVSPESSLCNNRWRQMFASKTYKERLIGVCVDEAHCIIHWGLASSNKKKSAFRIWYSRLNELRSLVAKGTPFLALTATAARQTRDQIFEMLEMKLPVEILESPNRPNVTFVVQKIDNSTPMVDNFRYLADELKSTCLNTKRTIIYCQTIKQCCVIYNIFNLELGDLIYIGGIKYPRNRMVEMLHSNTPQCVKEHVMDMFSKSDSHLRILVATIAYGMGVNCKNVTRVIHFGPSSTVEAYVQESGRCGRQGQQSCAILLYNGITIRAANEAMKLYIKGTSCRRRELLRHFDYISVVGSDSPTGHLCCDFCIENCSCSDGHCNVQLKIPVGDKNINTSEIPKKVREVTDAQKTLLIEKLTIMAKTIATKSSSPTPVISANALMQFESEQVSQVVDNCSLLFSHEDVMKHVDIWRQSHAKMIVNIISSVFNDVQFMDSDDDDDDDNGDGNVDSYHNEWYDVLNDDSFLSLINQSGCHMESCSESEQSTIEMEESYPSFLDSVICNIDET